MFERALNYLHTGNAAVIATTVMNPLWIGRSLIADGLPCFNPEIAVVSKNGPTNVKMELWPYDTQRHRPFTASARSQILTYGENHFNVSISFFHVIHFFHLEYACKRVRAL